MVYTDAKYKSRDRNKKSSQRLNKKIKQDTTPIRKDNYKKKVIEKVECCICFGTVENTRDNSIQCGKTTHFMCGDCKVRCNETGNDKCPMCRSHPIKNPTFRKHNIDIYYRRDGIKMKKPRSLYLDDTSRMSIKQRRNYFRNSSTECPFHSNTNRIVRQTEGWTSRPTSYRIDFDGRVPANRIYHPDESDYSDNISDTDSDTSDSDTSDSDTVSTLSLVDWTDDDMGEISEYMDMVVASHE